MRNYPFFEDPASPLRLLGALTRAGLRPPTAALVIREGGRRAQDPPTLHCDASCPMNNRGGELAMISTAAFCDLGRSSDVQLCECEMAESTPLARWVDERRELATALIALEAADEIVPLPDPGAFDAFDIAVGDMDLFGYDVSTQTTLGWLSAIAIGLRRPPVSGKPSEADPYVAQMTDEAITALEETVAERMAWVHPRTIPQGPMERWLLFDTDAYLTDPLSGAMLPVVQRLAFRSLVIGRFVGFLSLRPTKIFVHAPAGLFSGKDLSRGAQYLGPADAQDTAESLTSMYYTLVEMTKDLRRSGVPDRDAEQAALISLLSASTTTDAA